MMSISIDYYQSFQRTGKVANILQQNKSCTLYKYSQVYKQTFQVRHVSFTEINPCSSKTAQATFRPDVMTSYPSAQHSNAKTLSAVHYSPNHPPPRVIVLTFLSHARLSRMCRYVIQWKRFRPVCISPTVIQDIKFPSLPFTRKQEDLSTYHPSVRLIIQKTKRSAPLLFSTLAKIVFSINMVVLLNYSGGENGYKSDATFIIQSRFNKD